MLKNERQNEILQILKQKGFVKVRDLCENLYASESSIRRDLSELEKQGFIKRSHGGAENISSSAHIAPFGTRSYNNTEEKYIIAKKAAQLVNENDIVFLDQSSTCYFLALFLRERKNITVVTNNIEIVNVLSKSNVTVMCSGGVISKDNNNCLIGNGAQNTFEKIYANIAFFSAKSVSSDGIISDCSQEEIYVRNSMFKNADKKVFLCDSKKLGTHASYIQCSLKDIDTVISDNNAFYIFKNKFDSLEML